jgi:23S rRNA pseudouridine2605 synthase
MDSGAHDATPAGKVFRVTDRPGSPSDYDRYRTADGLWRPSRPEGVARLLAKAGYGARPRAEDIVRAGRVTIDGAVATDPGQPVTPDSEVMLDGEVLREAPRRYLVLHKPPGYDCQPRSRAVRSITRLLPGDAIGLEPAGRLDTRGSGLLLVSNDQRWNTHVAGAEDLERRYEIRVSGQVTEIMLDVLRGGIAVPNKGAFRPERIDVVRTEAGTTVLAIALREGHARRVRAAFGSVRCEVEHMTRTGLGPLSLGDLRVGAWRALNVNELESLSPPAAGSSRR